MWIRPPSPQLYFSHLDYGDMSKECKRFFNRLADLIAGKKEERYCDVVRYVRKRIRLAMFRTTLIVVARCVNVPRRASSNASRSDMFSLDRRDALLCLAELRRIDIVN